MWQRSAMRASVALLAGCASVVHKLCQKLVEFPCMACQTPWLSLPRLQIWLVSEGAGMTPSDVISMLGLHDNK